MKNMGLGTKLIILTTFVVLITSGGLIFLSYNHSYNELEEAIGIRLESIATTGAQMLNGELGDYHKKLDVDTKDTKARQKQATQPQFQKIQSILKMIKSSNKLKEAIYTFRFSDGNLKFGAMTQKNTYIGNPYITKQYVAKASVIRVFQDKASSRTKIYRSPNGIWISGHAPFFDSKGKIAGVLAIDIRAKTFFKQLYAKITTLLMVSFGILFLGILLSVFFSRWLVKRLHHLREAAERISLGEVDAVIKADAQDEIGQLAQSVERMRESLKVAMEMLDDDDDDD